MPACNQSILLFGTAATHLKNLLNRIKKKKIKYECKLVLQTLKLRMFEYFITEHLNANLRLHPSLNLCTANYNGLTNKYFI